VDDLHLFETYWSDSALPATRPCCRSRGASKIHPVWFPCPKPASPHHCLSALHSDPPVTPTGTPSGNPADAKELADAGELADAEELTDAGERADVASDYDPVVGSSVLSAPTCSSPIPHLLPHHI
jgi:hypothetical protein